MTPPPAVTVLMPVYNAKDFLDESISSILHQTFKDFEFLIIDDGSTDSSLKIVRKYKDPRIRFVVNKKHQGLVPVLNQGLILARGQYLVRMDADDISSPSRIEKQLKYIDWHPEVGVCGTSLEVFGPGRKDKVYPRPTTPEAAKAVLLFSDPVHHGTVILRMSMVKKHRLRFDPRFKHLEDYEFWNRIASLTSFANLPEVLYRYRYHNARTGYVYEKEQQEQMRKIQAIYLKKLGIKNPENQINLHWQIMTRKFTPTRSFLESARRWLAKLNSANRKKRIYDQREFSKTIAQKWDFLCRDSSQLGIPTFQEYLRSPVDNSLRLDSSTLMLFLSCFKATVMKSIR